VAQVYPHRIVFIIFHLKNDWSAADLTIFDVFLITIGAIDHNVDVFPAIGA